MFPAIKTLFFVYLYNSSIFIFFSAFGANIFSPSLEKVIEDIIILEFSKHSFIEVLFYYFRIILEFSIPNIFILNSSFFNICIKYSILLSPPITEIFFFKVNPHFTLFLFL